MSIQRFTPEFKQEAVKQVSERGRPVEEAASMLGARSYSQYRWIDK